MKIKFNKVKAIMVLVLLTKMFFAQAQVEKPNVLFIPIDDLKPMLGCYGDENVKTPNENVCFAALAQYNRHGPSMGYTLRSKRYRYVKWLKMNYQKGERTGKLVATELYDYQNDPLETVNLADNPKYKEIVDRFETEFKERKVAQIK